jgi:hypothetical protein
MRYLTTLVLSLAGEAAAAAADCPSGGGLRGAFAHALPASLRWPFTRGDRRVDKSRLRVATFNLHFLFDDISPSSPAESATHVEGVSTQLLDLDADIVALQEVESCEMLRRLTARLNELNEGRGGGRYRFFLVQGKDRATYNTP